LAGLIFHPAAPPRVGELVTRDPEQPSPRVPGLSSKRGSGFERRREDLRREIRGDIRPAGGAPEEPKDLRLKPFVEDPERLGIARGEHQQFSVIGLGVIGMPHQGGFSWSEIL
jgi:hypothetical protein